VVVGLGWIWLDWVGLALTELVAFLDIVKKSAGQHGRQWLKRNSRLLRTAQ
jgi:hypothetical protein